MRTGTRAEEPAVQVTRDRVALNRTNDVEYQGNRMPIAVGDFGTEEGAFPTAFSSRLIPSTNV